MKPEEMMARQLAYSFVELNSGIKDPQHPSAI
jgi:hypothetical protein